MLITLEGGEGSGKTSISEVLPLWIYKTFGIWAVLMQEPGGTDIGMQIREVVHNAKNKGMHPKTELLLYQASRAQLVEQRIKPELARGNTVILDRYADSTRAYQGGGRGLDEGDVEWLVNFVTGGLTPDLTFYLDVDPEIGLKRRIEGQREINRLDMEKLAFHRSVRDQYWKMAKVNVDGRWRIILADRPWDYVLQRVQLGIEQAFARRGIERISARGKEIE